MSELATSLFRALKRNDPDTARFLLGELDKARSEPDFNAQVLLSVKELRTTDALRQLQVDIDYHWPIDQCGHRANKAVERVLHLHLSNHYTHVFNGGHRGETELPAARRHLVLPPLERA